MAGKSHNHTMNIGIKVDASGIGKTNSELKNISNEVNGLNGKKIDLQINLGDKASKTIDSITSSIGNMEKSLNNISTKGIQGIQDAVSGATKSIDSLTSAIGSVQKSLDGISARGLTTIQDGASGANKALQDVSTEAGHTQTAIDSINGKAFDDMASSISAAADQLTNLASQAEKVSTVSGLGDNWNNSYGGRYGGMRYTGQGKGISDVVSFLGGGKNSYQLTIENAMNKTRNMAVAKSWSPEDDVSGMDAYWSLDAATNHSLMSLNTLAAGINATAATTGASAKDIKNHARDFADFGTMVMGLGYTEDVAQTAVMKLGRGLHGTFAALDQYGITKESLTNTGLWNGDENDLDGFMAAVSKYSRTMSDNLLSTTTGQMATLSKSASLGGYALGEMEAQSMRDVVGAYKTIDDKMRSWTKSLNIPWLSGADVHDNLGQRVLSRVPMQADGITPQEYIDYNNNGVYDKDIDEAIEESLYVSNQPGTQGKIVNDKGEVVYDSIEQAYSAGFNQKRTGVGLSTLIIGADQVISTYKTIKDTILGTFAEYRDLKRIKQIGLRNIFKGDDYDLIDGHLVKKAKGMQQDMCDATNGDCPQQRANEKKKKKGLFGRTKDKIKNTTNKIRELPSDIATGTKDRIGKTKDKIGKTKNKIKTKMDNPYNIISNPDFKGYGKPIGPKISRPKERKGYFKHSGKERLRSASKSDFAQRNGVKINKFDAPISEEEYRKIHGPDYTVKEGSSSAKFNKPYKSATKMTDTFEKWKREGLEAEKARKLSKELDSKNNSILKGKDTRYSGISNKISDKYGNFKNKISNSKNSLGNYFSADNKKREAAGNKYGGYMKRTNKAIYDTKHLKSKAKNYIKNKKKLIQKEFAEGQLAGAVRKRVWGDKGKQLPYKAWDKAKTSAKNFGGYANEKLSNSALSSQWQSLKNQGGFIRNKAGSLKDTVTGSKAWQGMSGFTTMAKTQAMGNMGAMWGMTHGGQKFSDSKYGQKISNMKQSWKNAGGTKGVIMAGAGKVGGAVAKGGGMVLGGMSTGMGAMAGAVGKIGGIMGGIMNGVMGILGPIGVILMAVTLITGLLDAMGVDWMGPLQTAFGGFIEAMQPVIQGLSSWMADTATKIAPALTRAGQILGPIVSALGSLLSGGLEALGNVLGPVFDGIASIFEGGDGGGLFDSLSKGLEGLGPILGQLGTLLGQGVEGFGGMLGSTLDGIGQYISSVILGLAQTISTFWTTIATGIQTAILTVINGITSGISSLATTLSSSIILVTSSLIASVLSYGGAIRGAILMILGGVAQGIGMVGSAINGYILGIGAAVTAVVSMVGGAVIGIVSGLGAVMAAAITMVAAAVIAGITGLATSITSGILMISTAILTTFTTFATTVATATAAAYAILLAFQGTAVGLMGTIATDMVNNFKNNFTGVASAVDSEMSGAYDALCYWGDLMIAKAEEIGSKMKEAMVNIGMGINSPGYIWNAVAAEFKGTWGAMQHYGGHLIQSAKDIGYGIVNNYERTFSNKNLDFSQVPLSTPATLPVETTTVPLPTSETPVSLPQVKVPQVAKDMKHKLVNDTDKPTVYNFNHYGDIDNDERADKVLKSIASRMSFENKRAGRTVNRPTPTK